MAPVSIIIPCHNYGRFLAEAIESALGQTLAAQEIVVIDDGSTDDSRAIARRYARDRRVRLLQQEHLGAIAAFHAGVGATSGQFFIILSADDRLDPHFIERTLPRLAADQSAAFAYTAYRLFGAQSRVLPAPRYSARRLQLRPYIIATVLMRRAAFEQVGGFDQSMAGALEDWDLYVKLAEQGWRGVAIPEVLFHYRRHVEGSRNTVGFRDTLALRARVYINHAPFYRIPLGPFLALTVLNVQYLRLRAAPRAFARKLGRGKRSLTAEGRSQPTAVHYARGLRALAAAAASATNGAALVYEPANPTVPTFLGRWRALVRCLVERCLLLRVDVVVAADLGAARAIRRRHGVQSMILHYSPPWCVSPIVDPGELERKRLAQLHDDLRRSG